MLVRISRKLIGSLNRLLKFINEHLLDLNDRDCVVDSDIDALAFEVHDLLLNRLLLVDQEVDSVIVEPVSAETSGGGSLHYGLCLHIYIYL